jgi:hypothetical protein
LPLFNSRKLGIFPNFIQFHHGFSATIKFIQIQ